MKSPGVWGDPRVKFMTDTTEGNSVKVVFSYFTLDAIKCSEEISYQSSWLLFLTMHFTAFHRWTLDFSLDAINGY